MNAREVLIAAVLAVPEIPSVEFFHVIKKTMDDAAARGEVVPDGQDVMLVLDLLDGLYLEQFNDVSLDKAGMPVQQHALARLRGMTLAEWKAQVLLQYPAAQFTLETGEGETYGEAGTTTAHVGPDMQADVVGVYIPAGAEEAAGANYVDPRPEGFCWIGSSAHYAVRTE